MSDSGIGKAADMKTSLFAFFAQDDVPQMAGSSNFNVKARKKSSTAETWIDAWISLNACCAIAPIHTMPY